MQELYWLDWTGPVLEVTHVPLVRFSINLSIRVLVFTGCILVLAAEVRYGAMVRFGLVVPWDYGHLISKPYYQFKTDMSIAGLFDEASFHGHGNPGLWFRVIDCEQGVRFLTFLRKTFPKKGCRK